MRAAPSARRRVRRSACGVGAGARVRAPNLLVLTSGSEPGSFVAEVADPDTAVAIFDMWPVRRQLRFSSAERFLRDGLLPVFRYGVHGLREVRNEDRIRARLIDGFVLLVLMIVVVLRFVPPSLGNIIGSFFLVCSCSRFRSPRGAG